MGGEEFERDTGREPSLRSRPPDRFTELVLAAPQFGEGERAEPPLTVSGRQSQPLSPAAGQVGCSAPTHLSALLNEIGVPGCSCSRRCQADLLNEIGGVESICAGESACNGDSLAR